MTNTNETTRFRANWLQVYQLMANAVNASVEAYGRPAEPHADYPYTSDDMFKHQIEHGQSYNPKIVVDYVDCRMVHLLINEVDQLNATDSVFEMQSNFDKEYQSFAEIYPTAKALLRSAGIHSIYE